MGMESIWGLHQAGLEEADYRRKRALAAQKICRIRSLERTDSAYIVDSTQSDYVRKVRGLLFYFDYVRNLSQSPKVLDVGTGTSRAIDEIARSPLGKGITFEATAFTRHTRMKRFLGKVHLTSAEVLRDISSESVSGILAIQSAGFSAEPSLVAESFDRVLCPGGVLKMTFRKKGSYGKKEDRQYKKWGYSTHDEFSVSLVEDLGYDVCILEADPKDPNADDVLLAIKPGGKNSISAKELLEKDAQSN